MSVATPSAATSPAKWTPYPTYKACEAEWLGGLPEHWEVKRLRDISWSLQTGPFGSQLHSEDYSPNGIPVINPSHMKDGHIYPDWDCSVDEETCRRLSRHQLVQGDIVFARRGELGRCALVTIVEEGWICGTGSLRVRPNRHKAEPLFLNWLLSTRGVSDWLSLESVGATMDNLSTNILARMPLPIPSLREQRTIATFLDRETARIDALVAKKERLIELLQEKRVALISQAVTKGLDATVPMRDSGVEWLGEIPVHWDVAPVYARYSVQLGKMLNQDAVRGASPALYLRNTNVQWDRVDLTDVLEMDFDPRERQKFALRPGDLLVCEGGEVGRTAVWRGELDECFFQKAVHRVRPYRIGEEGRFLFYVLYAAANRGVFVSEGNRSTIVHLTAEKLRKHRFGFPPPSEQQAIVAFVDRETAKIDTIIAKVREHIEKLREYRTALISAAVTGKIDMREETA
jgi:type I restriction enzyme, S subunit